MKQYTSLLQKHHSTVSTSRLTPHGSPHFLEFLIPGIAPGSEQAVLTQPDLEPSHC